jgi:methylated-DNA-protein-cysteine methyltransferase related protein
MQELRAFREAVLALVAVIPEGHVVTYGQIARVAGYPRRPRQVGMVLKGLPEDTALPWHRVVNAQGLVPSRGRFWSALEQIERLRREEIEVSDVGALDLERYQWRGEFTPRPQD